MKLCTQGWGRYLYAHIGSADQYGNLVGAGILAQLINENIPVASISIQPVDEKHEMRFRFVVVIWQLFLDKVAFPSCICLGGISC